MQLHHRLALCFLLAFIVLEQGLSLQSSRHLPEASLAEPSAEVEAGEQDDLLENNTPLKESSEADVLNVQGFREEQPKAKNEASSEIFEAVNEATYEQIGTSCSGAIMDYLGEWDTYNSSTNTLAKCVAACAATANCGGFQFGTAGMPRENDCKIGRYAFCDANPNWQYYRPIHQASMPALTLDDIPVVSDGSTGAITVGDSAIGDVTAFGEVRIFFIIDTSIESTNLQEGARATWLQDVRTSRHDYRFVLFDGKGLEIKSDMIVVPLKFNYSERFQRSFARIKYGFDWAVANSKADYIVKVDHDFFVCTHHLEAILAHAPRERYHLAYFWTWENQITAPAQPAKLYAEESKRQGMWCRPDEDFLLYSKDVVALALERFRDLTPENHWAYNWAITWGLLSQHLFANDNLTVVDDMARIDSQQKWHYEPDQETFPSDYCTTMIGMHIFESRYKKRYEDFDGGVVMKKLWDLHSDTAQTGSARTLAEPLLESPSCYQQIDISCKLDMHDCQPMLPGEDTHESLE